MKPMDERAEALIREAQALTEKIASARGMLALIETELDRYFPQHDQVEHVVSEFGSAHRVVEENTRLDPDRVAEVMCMLGCQFGQYFTFKPWCLPTEQCLAAMRSGDSYQGAALRDYVLVDRVRRYSYSPGRRVMPVRVEKAS
jgi:hypothetical protein